MLSGHYTGFMRVEMDISLFKNPNGRLVKISDGGHAFVPNPLPPKIKFSDELYYLNSKADRALAELSGLTEILDNPRLLIVPYMHQEAVSSSAIEGTQSTLSDLFLSEIDERHESNHQDIREVRNYLAALEYCFSSERKLPLSLRLVRELHRILLKDVRGFSKRPGIFRKEQNYIAPDRRQPISEASYVPPPKIEMGAALEQWEKFVYSEIYIPPLIQAALMHYQFEAIHPFSDGNGRIGRLLISLFLQEKGVLSRSILFSSKYFERTRQEYYQCLQDVSTESNWHQWISYFLRGVEEQCRINMESSRKIISLHRKYRNILKEAKVNARFLTILDELFISPYIDVRKARAITNVSYPTAKSDLELLQETGILSEIPILGRGRLHRMDELYKILEA